MAFRPGGIGYTAGMNNFRLNHAVSFGPPDGRAGVAVATVAEANN
ncbi:MAG: hypothetical protein OXU61_04695 [Gammaproteobacteria bacterium]|nr:hypothetical protein [Gammaproteobacteria bacterium]